MAIAAGMTSAIVNPIHGGLVKSVHAADVLAGNDANCENWISKYREPPKEGEAAAGGKSRRGGGRRRRG